MEFVMMRDRTVVSTLGHSVEFKKGAPTHVPPALIAEVLAAGGITKDEIPEDEAKKTLEPTDPNERAELIQEAIKIVVERANRDDFTATGAPSPKVLSTELGWPISAKERDLQWAAYQASQG